MDKSKVYLIVIGLLMLLGISVDGKPMINRQNPDPQKVLIVYLSRTNNTKAIADMIHQQIGGKRVALELVNPYPKHYQTTVAQVAHENETGFLPPLKTTIDNIEQYDLIFVGFPTWGMQLPPPVKSFLKQYNLKGKTIIPFNTNAGYGVGSSIETIRKLCPESKILDGYKTRGGIEKEGKLLMIKDEKATSAAIEVQQWLRKIGILKRR